MSADSTKKTIIVALGVCIVCSIFVSAAAVSLRGIQEENKKLDKLKNILEAADLLTDVKRIKEIYSENIQTEIITLKTGEAVLEEKFDEILNIENFDIKKMTGTPKYTTTLSQSRDLAKIKKIPTHMPVYMVKKDNKIEKVILPIYGKGLWSTMYGFIAIDKDIKTVKGFTFYEHGETPGLGGEIDNPRWKASWKGKKLYDKEGKLKIEVIKGLVDPSNPKAIHQIDGLSGSTLTTRGVDQTVKFWLGEDGYKTFIERLKKES